MTNLAISFLFLSRAWFRWVSFILSWKNKQTNYERNTNWWLLKNNLWPWAQVWNAPGHFPPTNFPTLCTLLLKIRVSTILNTYIIFGWVLLIWKGRLEVCDHFGAKKRTFSIPFFFQIAKTTFQWLATTGKMRESARKTQPIWRRTALGPAILVMEVRRDFTKGFPYLYLSGMIAAFLQKKRHRKSTQTAIFLYSSEERFFHHS